MHSYHVITCLERGKYEIVDKSTHSPIVSIDKGQRSILTLALPFTTSLSFYCFYLFICKAGKPSSWGYYKRILKVVLQNVNTVRGWRTS